MNVGRVEGTHGHLGTIRIWGKKLGPIGVEPKLNLVHELARDLCLTRELVFKNFNNEF